MLVINRKEGEVIYVGDDIEIMLCKVNGKGAAKIGIRAPSHVPVHRKKEFRDEQKPCPPRT